MGLSREQKFGSLVNQVAWLTWRERVRLLRYLLNPRHRAS